MHLMKTRAAAIAVAMGIGLSAHAGPNLTAAPERFPDSPITETLAAAADAEKVVLQRLNLGATEPGQPVRVSVWLEDELVEFDLHPYSGRAEDCVLLIQGEDGELVEAELPPARTWRGMVDGDPSRVVAASIDATGGMHAVVRDEVDGRTWGVQPVEAGAGEIAAAFAGWTVTYAGSDVLPTNGLCGVGPDERPVPVAGAIRPRLPEQGGLLGGFAAGPRPMSPTDAIFDEPDAPEIAQLGGPVRADLLFDADWEYFLLNGSSVAAVIEDIETVMNVVGLNYQNQLGISYRYTGFVVRTTSNDPYDSSDSITRLCEFRTEWNGNPFVPRDNAHLFTGVEIDGDVIGRAYFAGFCNQTDGACDGGARSYGFSQSRFSNNFNSRVILTQHEYGHNWNACHCNQSGCTGGNPDGDCGTMWSSVNGATQTFGFRSTLSINQYRSSLTCLDASYNPVFCNSAWAGFENGSVVFPFNTLVEGIWAVPVGGVVSFAPGTYSQNAVIVKPMVLQRNGSSGSAVLGN